jgi:DNA-binding beta-propeller fold protein YncE
MRRWFLAMASIGIAGSSCSALVGEDKDFHAVGTDGGSGPLPMCEGLGLVRVGGTGGTSSGSGPCNVCPPDVPLCLAPLAPVASLPAACKSVLTPCDPHIPPTCEAVGTYPVGMNPLGIAFDGANMWVANGGSEYVTVLPPNGAPRTVHLPEGSNPQAIAFDGKNMWIASGVAGSDGGAVGSGTVTKLSPSGVVLGTFAVGSDPKGIAFDGTNMWVTGQGDGTVTVLSPTQATPVMTFSNVGTAPLGIAFDGANMWVANQGDATVMGDGTVTVLPLNGTCSQIVHKGGHPTGIAFDGTNMWVTDDSQSGAVIVLSANASSFGAQVHSFPVDVYPDRIAFDGTNMWVANFYSGTVIKLSPTGASARFTLGGYLTGIAFDGTHMWVTDYLDNIVTDL